MNICRAYMDCKEPPLSYQDDDFNFFFINCHVFRDLL